MSERDVCSRCEMNYVVQDDARCFICSQCQRELDDEQRYLDGERLRPASEAPAVRLPKQGSTK
jgi:uncharacterized Zn ribbon protein